MASQKASQNRLKIAVNIATILLVLLWVIPTFGLFVTSFRNKDQLAVNGWWKSLSSTEAVEQVYLADPATAEQVDGKYVVKGNIFDELPQSELKAFALKQKEIGAFKIGETAQRNEDQTVTLNEDGSYVWTSTKPFDARAPRIYVTTEAGPDFTTDNYKGVIYEKNQITNEYELDENGKYQWSKDVARAFLNSLTVAIPATIIPILVAAFSAYALAWMRFPGRAILISVIVGLLVVPLQISLVPVLKMHVWFFHDLLGGDPKGYMQLWFAHTGFGLPLAIYLLRNYMAGLPREIIESARVDGATDFNIFVKIVLPLSLPALASFSIFQFLWTWNDFLVASIFGRGGEDQVLTQALKGLLGTKGGNWEILSTSAFISIIIPLIVFFAMQKFLVRGLLAGSVK